MFRTKEDAKKANTEILERYLKQYKELKKYVESATEAEKQTEYYKYRLCIVEGIDEVYPTLSEEMKCIVDGRYWYKDYEADWAELADELGITVSKARGLRDVIIRKISEAIGWV